MIQINLLPEVKREYLKAQQVKHVFTIGSILITCVAVGLLALLFVYVQFVQPRHRANLQTDIDSGISDLKKKEDAVKIVTVQGVLEQIPGLQDKKAVTSRLFGYLTQFTPRDVSFNKVDLDLTANTISLGGQTSTLERANVLANNLKSATFEYKQNDAVQKLKPFSNVVFGSLGKAEQTETNQNVTFQISFTIDPILFKQGLEDAKITVNATSEELLLPTTSPFSASSVNIGVPR